jgi:hypothetical protein
VFNSDLPARAELPTAARLFKSTLLALAAAIAILVAIVLPAEYAVDPTGVGRALGLTQMGEIKRQLSIEAEEDRRRDAERAGGRGSSLAGPPSFASLFVGSARAAERPALAQAAGRSDETTIVLRPTEGVEWKMSMKRGAQMRYAWTVQGGVVNYDFHGTSETAGRERSIKTGRGVGADEGAFAAPIDGDFGWFFRNRDTRPVTVVLRTSGAYENLRRM